MIITWQRMELVVVVDLVVTWTMRLVVMTWMEAGNDGIELEQGRQGGQW